MEGCTVFVRGTSVACEHRNEIKSWFGQVRYRSSRHKGKYNNGGLMQDVVMELAEAQRSNSL